MKIAAYRQTVLLIALFISAFTFNAHAAVVKNWQFKGSMQWTALTGHAIPVDYAEASVSDDRLAILYDKRNRQWYMQFTYIDDRQLTQSKNKSPEFFVRTRSNLGSGRYESDYVISRKARVFYNDPGKPQYLIMELDSVDLPYLKVGLNVGAGYFLTNKCKEVVANMQCIDLGEFRTYRFPGTNIAQAIEQIERRNGLKISKATSVKQRKSELKQQQKDQRTVKLLEWYHGNWAEFASDGTPLYGGCNAKRTIDSDRFPNLKQKGRFLGKRHTGTLAISAQDDSHDSLYFSSAYAAFRANVEPLLPAISSSETKKIPIFVEEGKKFMRLRLGEAIPGFSYNHIIDTDGKMLRLTAAGTDPMYFVRCK